MKHCPITYELINDDENYSRKGLRLLSPSLQNLQPLAFDAAQLRQEAIARAGKMSVQGVQTKLSAQLKVKHEMFELVNQYGHFILKPQSEYYPELPENEAVTMRLATKIGLNVPVHGLLYSRDGSMTYFIKRFDRVGHSKRLPVEDFAQLLGYTRDTKYSSSMEQVIKVITSFCSFPKIELLKLFKLMLFNFLIGNEDMHLKNFSLISKEGITTLSPAYDLVNSSIVLGSPKEEIALPLDGKKRNLVRKDFINAAEQRMQLNKKTIDAVLTEIQAQIPSWMQLIKVSFLSEKMKIHYLRLLADRTDRLYP